MTVDGEFLHYIFPLQFLDSPEWDSLRPTEEGIFQVKVKGLLGFFNTTENCSSTNWFRNKFT